MHQVDRRTEGREPFLERVARRVDPDGVDARVAPHLQAVTHHVRGTDQGGGQNHVVGDQRRRAGAVTGLPAFADRGRDLGQPCRLYAWL